MCPKTSSTSNFKSRVISKTKTLISAHDSPMGFCRGDQIEIMSNEEGFKGSYFSAIVVKEHDKEYIVQYKTLLKEDLSGPLREVVVADEIRPVPPEISASEFGMLDKVDAFDNDGWWVGKITGKLGKTYMVYFEDSKHEVAYPFNLLRVHQDWIDGKWVSSYENKGVTTHAC